jgi:predicted ester cyclase
VEITAEDDRVVARTRYTGTHRGELFGVAPTGRSIAYDGAAFFRIANGQVSDGWILGDLLAVLRQVGADRVP